MPLSIVILAAGQGKRMKSDLPKVLQPLAGRPLLSHVVAPRRRCTPTRSTSFYGHGGEQVKQALAGEPVNWVLQAEQLGTGHARSQAMPAIPDDHQVLILFGDVPLRSRPTLEQLAARRPARSALLTVMLDDPGGYGRIVRDDAGNVVRIVEEKDANTKERAIREINTGLMIAPRARCASWLAALKNDNAQGEYYLTDIVVDGGRATACKSSAVICPTEAEVLGVNDKVQLAELEAALRAERANALMLEGVTLADPARIDIRGEVSVGRDVFIDVNVVMVGTVELGDRVRIGPNCYLKDCQHRRRHRAASELRHRPHRDRRELLDRSVRAPAARERAAR